MNTLKGALRGASVEMTGLQTESVSNQRLILMFFVFAQVLWKKVSSGAK